MNFPRVSATISDYSVEPFRNTNRPRTGTGTAAPSYRESSMSACENSARDTMSMSSKPTDAGTEITPVSRCRTTVKLISQGLRRISARVVNIAGTSLEDEGHVRLRSDDGAERVAEGGERLEAVGEPLLGPSSVLRSPVRTHTRILGADKSLLARDLQFSDIPVRGFVLFFLLGPCSVPYCRTGGPKLPFFVRSFFTPFC